MAKTESIKVTVIDITTDKPVVSNVHVQDAAKAIKVKPKTFYNAMNRGNIIAHIYKIVVTGKIEREVNAKDFEEKIAWEEDFMNRWDEMHQYVQNLKIKMRRRV